MNRPFCGHHEVIYFYQQIGTTAYHVQVCWECGKVLEKKDCPISLNLKSKI